MHAELQFNGNGVTNGPNWDGNGGQANRLRNYYQYRSRQDLNMDTRTATEYGVVRTFADMTFTWTGGGGDNIAGGSLGVYHAFIQFAGFTLGRTISQFTSPWGGGPGNNTSYLIGGDDTATGVNQIAYTASFGNGVTASISLEEQSKYRNSQLFNLVGHRSRWSPRRNSRDLAGWSGSLCGSYCGCEPSGRFRWQHRA